MAFYIHILISLMETMEDDVMALGDEKREFTEMSKHRYRTFIKNPNGNITYCIVLNVSVSIFNLLIVTLFKILNPNSAIFYGLIVYVDVLCVSLSWMFAKVWIEDIFWGGPPQLYHFVRNMVKFYNFLLTLQYFIPFVLYGLVDVTSLIMVTAVLLFCFSLVPYSLLLKIKRHKGIMNLLLFYFFFLSFSFLIFLFFSFFLEFL